MGKKISSLDLNWPEVTFFSLVLFVIVAWFRPEVLEVVVEAIEAIARPIGEALARSNPFKG